MSGAWRSGTGRVLTLSAAAHLRVLSGVASTEAGAAGVPENASAKAYGDGRVCNRGFRQDSGACLVIAVPANAPATKTSCGRGWQSRRG